MVRLRDHWNSWVRIAAVVSGPSPWASLPEHRLEGRPGHGPGFRRGLVTTNATRVAGHGDGDPLAGPHCGDEQALVDRAAERATLCRKVGPLGGSTRTTAGHHDSHG